MSVTLQDVERGYAAWAAKPHNAKWVRKIDGTPIANDLVVNIFEALKELEKPPARLQEIVEFVSQVSATDVDQLAGFAPAELIQSDATPTSRSRVTGFRGNPLRVVLSIGEEATISQKLIDSFASPSPFETHPDDVAVDRFAAAMKAKLAKKRADGAGGWDDPQQCHIDYLVALLVRQIQERSVLDPVDIANLSMMIHERGETPSHGR